MITTWSEKTARPNPETIWADFMASASNRAPDLLPADSLGFTCTKIFLKEHISYLLTIMPWFEQDEVEAQMSSDFPIEFRPLLYKSLSMEIDSGLNL